MKRSDRFIISITLFLLSFALFSYLLDSYIISALIGGGFSILFLLLIRLIKPRENITIDEFAKRILLFGKEESDKLIEKLNPNAVKTEYGYINNNGIILNKLKYSPLSEEDIASAYRLAIKENIENIAIYCLRVDKKAILLINELLQTVKTVPIKKLYSQLKKENILPDKAQKIKKKGFKGLIVGLYYIPTKHFLFVGLVLAILSLISPIKLYYLIFAFINIAIGLILEIIKKKSPIS